MAAAPPRVGVGRRGALEAAAPAWSWVAAHRSISPGRPPAHHIPGVGAAGAVTTGIRQKLLIGTTSVTSGA